MPVGGIAMVDMRGKGYAWEGVCVKDAFDLSSGDVLDQEGEGFGSDEAVCRFGLVEQAAVGQRDPPGARHEPSVIERADLREDQLTFFEICVAHIVVSEIAREAPTPPQARRRRAEHERVVLRGKLVRASPRLVVVEPEPRRAMTTPREPRVSLGSASLLAPG